MFTWFQPQSEIIYTMKSLPPILVSHLLSSHLLHQR